MDKDYSKYYVIFLVATLLLTLVFGVKDLLHKKEISNLLKVQSVKCTVEPSDDTNTNDINAIKLGSIAETETTLSDKNNKVDKDNTQYIDKNSSKKIYLSSTNVEKKQQNGIDLISTNKAINNTKQTVDINNTYIHTNLDDIQLLARLIQSEAGDEPYQGKLAVGNVVLYRTNQDNESIVDTIFKKGQFDGVNTSNFNSELSDDNIKAATEVLDGKKVLSDGYFFVNLKVASPSWAKEDNFITRIGDHWFFRKE
ncbi:cell wall hydrolase [Clostridium botulinum]|uniref:Cell wall hydrolase n=1 Tax=Clostridium botulinum TaxID=1491 RepID=A0A126JHS4_CLOBO|nr:cell wall hydrolase [Clostridium botulinum]ALT05291.1 putative cell wall hydrolase [Clostridium botulinum]MBN1050403.1 cell wall hydrolase [Clostridium botulinum]MCS6112703.1 cell wall hydrolase [Clostridium botulinum]NFF89404.1 cell wall hydrolase [Clostridium botulinum]NFG11557.1 cell wall hydrolase [Clostridium botulinum]